MYAQKLSFDYAHTLHTVRIVHNAHSVHRSRVQKGQSCDCINFVRATEPSMGNGAFFANMPQTLKENARLYGVELNTITGRIAQQLYPEAEIEVNGFEDTKFEDGFFDAAVGNVPFGSFKVYDPKYNDKNLLIHDYFFIKGFQRADIVMSGKDTGL